ncbi:hypothetical protein CcaverHIS631_0506080 [Cutaneotrichosporon cavernicola]|nr:hypothetical protein CcaverHIS631_0506080 [Cutaneotrichosporon cavernicola]BEJ08517.1 hypothetical protein CcaverHIS641_0506110 [Cutaneotrichosporon cavernicola]
MASTAETPLSHKWALPESLERLLALDATARADAIEELLKETHPNVLPVTTRASSTTLAQAPSAPFLDALHKAPDSNTWNNAPAFSSTDSALLDLFNELQDGARPVVLFGMLSKAWEEDADKTLRIIFHTRSIHEGKGLRVPFFNCVAWLWDNHPRTLLANLRLIVEPTCERARPKKKDAAKAEANNNVMTLDEDGEPEKEPGYPPRPHGSFDDLNDILVLAISGQLTTSYTGRLTAIDEALAPASSRNSFKAGRLSNDSMRKRRGFANAAREALKSAKIEQKAVAISERGAGRAVMTEPTDGGPSSNQETQETRKRKVVETESVSLKSKLARCGSKQMRDAVIAEHTDKGLADPKVQILMTEVVNIYTDFLKADLERLQAHNVYLERPEAERKGDGYGAPNTSPHLFGMTYAAKWAPTPGKSADKQLHIVSALAREFFPADNKARIRFQTEVLTPLRRVLDVPESQMVKGEWTINYSKVPARCMARNDTMFLEHDPRGFDKYLLAVAAGKRSISAASLVPHEVLKKSLDPKSSSAIISRVANLQWASLVDSIRSSVKGELSNCIAVADVSGSMGSVYYSYFSGGQVEPIWPCLALTLLMTELARPPWNGTFITFSSSPRIERVDNTLPVSERARNLSQADWGQSTNYAAVFDSILRVAKENKLAPEDMVKTVFVFSDMQFDESGHFGETEHRAVVRRFEEASYPMPELVYWNLQSAATKPVQADTPGCALVSGFSGALMKYFIRALGDGGDEEPGEDEGPEEDEDWDDLEDLKIVHDDEDSEGKKTKAEAKTKPAKEEKTPMDHLNATIAAKPFRGVVVVD